MVPARRHGASRAPFRRLAYRRREGGDLRVADGSERQAQRRCVATPLRFGNDRREWRVDAGACGLRALREHRDERVGAARTPRHRARWQGLGVRADAALERLCRHRNRLVRGRAESARYDCLRPATVSTRRTCRVQCDRVLRNERRPRAWPRSRLRGYDNRSERKGDRARIEATRRVRSVCNRLERRKARAGRLLRDRGESVERRRDRRILSSRRIQAAELQSRARARRANGHRRSDGRRGLDEHVSLRRPGRRLVDSGGIPKKSRRSRPTFCRRT